MYRYYISRGHTLAELINLSAVEKWFMIQAMQIDLEEQDRMYRKMWGNNGE